MRILDDSGRVFGRVNLVDAGVALFVVVLVPLAYLSWQLFRLPPPVVDQVIPAVVTPGKDATRLQLRGRHLRPYLRAYIGGTGGDYLYEAPDRAEIKLPQLGPGTYDLVLFDAFAEISRFPKALRVEWSPEDVVTTLARNRRLEAQRIELRGWHLNQLLQAYVGGKAGRYTFMEPDRAEVELPALEPGTYDVVLLKKDDVDRKELGRYAKAVTVVEQRVVVRAVARPDVIEMIKQDLVTQARAVVTTQRPVLESFVVTDEFTGPSKYDSSSGRLCAIRAVVRVGAIRTPDGWQYEGLALKVGEAFHLESVSYVLDGEIQSVEPNPAGKR
jgi:hypothetical protein